MHITLNPISDRYISLMEEQSRAKQSKEEQRRAKKSKEELDTGLAVVGLVSDCK